MQWIKNLQTMMDGKKQMIASLLAAIAATGTILLKFAEQGQPYLSQITSSPEFAAASMGWIGFFNSLSQKKVRNENAVIIGKLDQVQTTADKINTH